MGRLDQMEKASGSAALQAVRGAGHGYEYSRGLRQSGRSVSPEEKRGECRSREEAQRHLQLEQMAKRAQEQRDSDDGWQD